MSEKRPLTIGEAFFRPAVVLMNHLKYRKKLALGGIIAAVIIFLLAFQLGTVVRGIIAFSDKELVGVRYIVPLNNLMERIQSYRNTETINAFSENKIDKSKIESMQDGVDRLFQNMNDLNDRIGSVLNVKEQWETILNKWQKIKINMRELPSGNIQNYDDILQDIRNLIVTACDNSNLTLDPDIDSYYLMDSVCTKFPSFSAESTLLGDLGYQALSKKNLSEEEKNQLAVFSILMNNFNKEAIKNNIEKVIRHNRSLENRFYLLRQTFLLQANSVVDLLNRSVLSGSFHVDSNAFQDKFAELDNTTSKLYEVSSSTLKELVQSRVDELKWKLHRGMVVTISCFFLLIYLFAGIYISIIRSVHDLVRGATRLSEGDMSTETKLETKDELAKVAESFNTMREILSKVINELQMVVTSVMQGDFSRRINLSDKKGFAEKLSVSINQLNDTLQDSIQEVVRVLDALSKGDLTVKILKDYQGIFMDLKSYTNTTVESLQKLITNIKIAAQTINQASNEIVLGNNDLAKRAEQQAAFLEETAASIEQLTAAVKHNTENAKQANQLAQSASDVAMKGGAMVSEVVNTMTEINESSKKVADIIGVIDGIASQTNILALNAAVEAARAGEQGKGFAVVAMEVRNLAQRSSAAAKEIKELIGHSVESVESGTILVDHAGNTMQDIVKSIKHVSEIMAEITAASIEQSSGIEQVNQAISQMDKVIQQNTSLAEEVVSSAESMEQQASHMDKLVNVFKLENGEGKETRFIYSSPSSKDAPKILTRKDNMKKNDWQEF